MKKSHHDIVEIKLDAIKEKEELRRVGLNVLICIGDYLHNYPFFITRFFNNQVNIYTFNSCLELEDMLNGDYSFLQKINVFLTHNHDPYYRISPEDDSGKSAKDKDHHQRPFDIAKKIREVGNINCVNICHVRLDGRSDEFILKLNEKLSHGFDIVIEHGTVIFDELKYGIVNKLWEKIKR